MDTIEQYKNIRSGPILIVIFVLSIGCYFLEHRMKKNNLLEREGVLSAKIYGHIEIVEELTRGDWSVKIRSVDQLALHNIFINNHDDFFDKYKFTQGDSVAKQEGSFVFTFFRNVEGDTLTYNY